MSVDVLRAPFPWFGGKSRAAPIIWDALGDVDNYCEPFAGTLAVLLSRPHAPRTETVNDKDAFICNFWRAIQADPEAVAEFADWPVNEADLHARHRWLVGLGDFRERMLADPAYHDPKVAGWWVWGICCWIGSGWCAGSAKPRQRGHGHPSNQLPHLGDAGMGIHRKLPHLGDAGRGEVLRAYFEALALRLRNVRVACGDWTRILGDSVTWRHGTTGIVLDPPYPDGEEVYAEGDQQIAHDVAAWARENGADKRLRIALCGYEGTVDMPATWQCVPWKAKGGYGSQRGDGSNENAKRERIWLSPGCVRGSAMEPLFARIGAE